MIERSVADIVADLRDKWESTTWPIFTEAADLLERIDALRPPCPTCDGESIVARPPNNVIASACKPCPDCADGRMSWERMAKLVTAVLNSHHWNDSDLREACANDS